MPGGLPIDCESEGDHAETGVPWNGQQCGAPPESAIGECALSLTPHERLMPLFGLATLSGGKMDTTFWGLENSYVGWEKRRGNHYDYIMTDLLAPTTNIVVFDDVIGATESDHLPIIYVTNHPRHGSRNKGPMRFDASRVPGGYHATDVSRNEHAGTTRAGEAHG